MPRDDTITPLIGALGGQLRDLQHGTIAAPLVLAFSCQNVIGRFGYMHDGNFGDINDYRKYGLLRVLSGHGQLRLAVAPMLTRHHGPYESGRDYLREPRTYRKYDPELFDYLRFTEVDECGPPYGRSIYGGMLESGLLTNATFLTAYLSDDIRERAEYSNRLDELARDSDLLFCDPTKGLQLLTIDRYRFPSGRRNFMYWDELLVSYVSKASVLVTQPLPRRHPRAYIEFRIKEISKRLEEATMLSFQTSDAVFLLIAHERHVEFFRQRLDVLSRRWPSDQIRVRQHVQADN